MSGRRDVIVLRVARKIRRGKEPQECRGSRVNSRRGDLIAGERLARGGIDELRGRCGEIACAHRRSWHRRVLIEEVVRFGAVVVDLKIRPPVRVLVETGNFQRAAERAAVCVLRKLRLGDRHIRPELVGRAVERRTAERIGRGSLIWILCARAAAAEYESTRPAKSTAGSAARSTTAAAESAGSSAGATRSSRRSEAGGELAGRGIELAGVDRPKAIVQQSAIDVGGAAGAAHGNRIALRTLEREPGRQERRHFSRLERGGSLRLATISPTLNIQRLEALAPAASRRSGTGGA